MLLVCSLITAHPALIATSFRMALAQKPLTVSKTSSRKTTSVKDIVPGNVRPVTKQRTTVWSVPSSTRWMNMANAWKKIKCWILWPSWSPYSTTSRGEVSSPSVLPSTTCGSTTTTRTIMTEQLLLSSKSSNTLKRNNGNLWDYKSRGKLWRTQSHRYPSIIYIPTRPTSRRRGRVISSLPVLWITSPSGYQSLSHCLSSSTDSSDACSTTK